MEDAESCDKLFPVLTHVAPRTELPSWYQVALQGGLICMIMLVLIVTSIAQSLARKLRRSLDMFPVMEVGAICGLFLIVVLF